MFIRVVLSQWRLHLAPWKDLKRDIVASLFSSNWLIFFYSLPYAASITSSWESSLSLGTERGRMGKLLLTVIFRGVHISGCARLTLAVHAKSGTQRYFLYKPSAHTLESTRAFFVLADDYNFPSISEELADR